MKFVALFFVTCVFQVVVGKDLLKKDPSGDVVIHATNKTSVPSIHYVIDAVDCLKQAYTVYSDSSDRTQVYAELFQEKHNETGWNVVAGYTAAYIKSKWYIEASVTNGKYQDSKKDSDFKSTLYLIFSTE
ncbi:hypothetical protein Zmor_025219 [Zophobas morio]|uniref:Salivary secreted peptide n=1 Tax=Zophobas morio TaxID=2755281 RepID=A0AA38M4F8_9CUCU|nr:hypothetical protein Zmor_025219 [Zophobas morio]